MKILSAFTACLLATCPAAYGLTTFSLQFSPTRPSGGSGFDTFGLAGSTWTITYEVNALNYTELFGKPVVEVGNVTLTLAGTTSQDGVYTLNELNGTNTLLSPTNSGDASGFAFVQFTDEPQQRRGYQVEGPGWTIESFTPRAPDQVIVQPEDAFEASHFDGLVFEELDFLAAGATFQFTGGVMSVTSVPEPAHASLLAGLIVMGGAGLLRRRRRAAR